MIWLAPNYEIVYLDILLCRYCFDCNSVFESLIFPASPPSPPGKLSYDDDEVGVHKRWIRLLSEPREWLTVAHAYATQRAAAAAAVAAK